MGCFYFVASMSNAAVNFIYRLLGHVFLCLLDIYLGEKLLGQMVTLCLTFRESVKLFSNVSTPFYIPTNSVSGSNFSISWSTFIVVVVFKISYLFYTY